MNRSRLLIGLVVGIHAVVTGGMWLAIGVWHGRSFQWPGALGIIAIPLAFAQVALVAAWAGPSRQSFTCRFVGMATLIVVWSRMLVESQLGDDWSFDALTERATLPGLWAAFFVPLAAAVVIGLSGFQASSAEAARATDGEPDRQASRRPRSGQLSVTDLLVLTAGMAVCLRTGQGVILFVILLFQVFLQVLFVVAAAAGIALVALRVTLGTTRRHPGVVLLFAGTVAAPGLLLAALHWPPVVRLYRVRGVLPGTEVGPADCLVASMAFSLVVWATVLMIREGGLRLVRCSYEKKTPGRPPARENAP